jgi:hypothetical protein
MCGTLIWGQIIHLQADEKMQCQRGWTVNSEADKTGYNVLGISLTPTWKLDYSQVPSTHFPFAYAARHYGMPLHSTAMFKEITVFITTPMQQSPFSHANSRSAG